MPWLFDTSQKTTRSRKVEYQAFVSGNTNLTNPRPAGLEDDGDPGSGATDRWRVWAPWQPPPFGPTILIDRYLGDAPGSGGPTAPNGYYGSHMVVSAFGLGDEQWDANPMPPTRNFSYEYEGEFGFSVEAEELTLLDLLDPTEAVYIDGIGFPNFGGNAQPDNLPAHRRRFLEIGKEGGIGRAYVTINGVTAEVVASLPAGFVIDLYAVFWEAEGGTNASAQTWTCDLEWNDGDGTSPGFPPYLWTRSGGGNGTGTIAATPTDSGFSLVGSSSAGIFQSATWRFETSVVGQPIERIYQGLVRAWDSPHPSSSLSVGFTPGVNDAGDLISSAPVVGGVYDSGKVKQRLWRIYGAANDVPGPDSSGNEQGSPGARCWMQGLNAGRAMDDPKDTDTRLQARGARWNAFTAAHAAAHQVLAAGESWTGGTAGGLGYRIQAGETATADLVGLDRIWEAYRYFRIPFKGIGGENRNVVITLSNDRISKEYRTTTAGDGATVSRDVDSAAPWNVPSGFEYDARNFRAKLRFQPSNSESPIATGPEESIAYLEPREGEDEPDEQDRGWLWGANRPTRIEIRFDGEEGETLEFGSVSLVRQYRATMSFLQAYAGGDDDGGFASGYDGYVKWWESTAAGGDTTVTGAVYAAPFSVLEIDGRIAFDHPHYWRDVPVVGEPSFVYPPISAMVGWWNAFPGVTATPSESAVPYVDNTAFAGYLGGGGAVAAVANDGTVEWRSYVERPIGGVEAQELLDEVVHYPGFGNGLNGGSFGVPTVIASWKSLGGRAEGFVFDPETRLPVEGARVDLEEGAGFGLTDDHGFYRTELPYGSVPIQHETVYKTYRSKATSRNRRRERTSFMGVVQKNQPGGIANLHFPDGSYWRAAIEGDGLTVRTGLLGGPFPNWYSTKVVSTEEGDANPCLTWDPSTSRGFLFWDRPDGTYASYTDSFGLKWSEPTLSSLIPGGRITRIRHNYPDGDALIVALVNDGGSGAGKLVGRFKGRCDLDWSPAFDLKAKADGSPLRLAGDPDAPLANYDLAPSYMSDGRWSLSLVRDGDDGPSEWFATDDGRRWASAA